MTERADRDITADDVSTYVFCPRKLWLRGNGDIPHNADTVRGKSAEPRGSQSAPVHDDTLGLYGVCDEVVENPDGSVSLVEHKSVIREKVPRIYDSYLAQIAAYVHCLESMGLRVADSWVNFTEHQRRVRVSDDITRFNVPDLVGSARAVLNSDVSPPMLEHDDPRCRGCSLADVCLPSSPHTTTPDPFGAILVIDNEVSLVRVRGEQLRVTLVNRPDEDVPIRQISGVLVSGYRATITTPAMVALLSAGICVSYALRGSETGYAAPLSVPNAATRCRVARLSDEVSLGLAIELVSAKVNNQSARIRPIDKEAGRAIRLGRDRLSDLAEKVRECANDVDLNRVRDEVFGIEGHCAEVYFDAMFSAVPGWIQGVSVRRIKRGATDPLNSMLNYGYAILASSVTRAIVACGLDPAAGVLHSVTRNPTPLTSDIMEPFRAPVVDSAIRSLLSSGTVTERGFTVTRNGAWVMSSKTRKDITTAVVKQLKTEHTYVGEAYRMTWERTIEYHIRTLLQFLNGSRSTWTCVRVR